MSNVLAYLAIAAMAAYVVATTAAIVLVGVDPIDAARVPFYGIVRLVFG